MKNHTAREIFNFFLSYSPTLFYLIFFFNDTAPPEFSPLSLHDALPIFIDPHIAHELQTQWLGAVRFDKGLRVVAGLADVAGGTLYITLKKFCLLRRPPRPRPEAP